MVNGNCGNTETEVKLDINGDMLPGQITMALHGKKAIVVSERRETNLIFDTKSRKLKKKNQILRLRFSESTDLDDSGKAEITVKGPAKKKNGINSRTEINLPFEFDSLDNARKILDFLGYEEVFLYEKFRRSHRYKNCLIEFDQLPNIGSYLEIEGPTHSDIEAVIKDFKWESLPRCTDSYIKLLKLSVSGKKKVTKFEFKKPIRKPVGLTVGYKALAK